MDNYLQHYNKLKIESNIFVTSNNAPAGTILLTQAPLTSVPFPSERLNRCNYCLRKGNLQCCSRCHSAYFCSNDCFLNAWINFHRIQCLNTDDTTSLDQILLERLALTLHSHSSLKKNIPILQQLSIDALNTLQLPVLHTSPVSTQYLHHAVKNTNWSLEDLSTLANRIKIASFQITDPDTHLDSIAIGIYPITSQYVRHSCRPNAGLIYKQGHQLLVALENIPPDTPVTISYVDLLATKQQRQDQLEQRFGFNYQCDCMRCQGEFKGLDTLLERGQSLDLTPAQLETTLEQQLKTWSVLEMIKTYASKDFDAVVSVQPLDAPHLAHFICRMIAPDIYVPALNKLGKKSMAAIYYNRLPPLSQKNFNRQDDTTRILPAINALLQRTCHSPFMTIAGIKAGENLLKRLVAEERWVEASRCTIYLFMMYRLVYPSLYPKMVYHSLVLTRASWNSLVQLELAGLGKKLEAVYQESVRLWILVALNSILKTFGQDNSLWREIVEIKWLFERDQKLKLNE
ncbi:hypothetical protein BDF21DRAFT_418029 [Thamnidium elegans]|uniref:MYND-type domain-containing protein n=1 Tax=Thamnidium elegans TaxID=101142 RepID=A0A8H7VUM2_9FUNG|nr:hypothetical protein INT48_007712 [Thamnidium elegans]KAI8080905.1 hypothetical protein BDF21DRAFT_418029 [Thamnidium elegans]